MKPWIGILGAGALLAFAAGCGSSSSSSQGDWQVVSKTQVSGKSKAGFLHARVARPSDVEFTVDATPAVKVKTAYTILCGNDLGGDAEGRKNRTGASGATPVTTTVYVPPGAPAPCYITAVATKTSPASMTVTLLSREAPA